MGWGGARVMREAAVRALEKPRHSVHLYHRAALSLGQERELGQDTWESTWLMRTGC